MTMLSAPEPQTRRDDNKAAQPLVAEAGKTDGMPMTTSLPGLWDESPLSARSSDDFR